MAKAERISENLGNEKREKQTKKMRNEQKRQLEKAANKKRPENTQEI